MKSKLAMAILGDELVTSYIFRCMLDGLIKPKIALPLLSRKLESLLPVLNFLVLPHFFLFFPGQVMKELALLK